MVPARKPIDEATGRLDSPDVSQSEIEATVAYDGDTHATSPSPSDSLPPSLEHYRILEPIARGGMGEVLRAVDLRFQRHLAIKVLLPRYAEHSDVRRRFLEEARIMAQLQHPGVPPVHDQGELPDGRPFMAMKLIRGETLAEILLGREGPADELPRLIDVFEQVCQTMAYAHSQGVIHRDLKPHNIMVGAFGEVQVMDWGLAKATATPPLPSVSDDPHGDQTVSCQDSSASTDKTQVGQFLGTPAYTAPEQARGEVERLDSRCDVFGLGAILCQILTGSPPFPVASKMDALRQAMQGDVADARLRIDRCRAEPKIVELARRCLAPKAEDRPAHAGEVADAVAHHRETVQRRLREADLSRAAAQAKAVEERKRRRVAVGLGGVALSLLLAAAVVSLMFVQNRAAQKAERLRVETAQAARASLVADAVASALDESKQARKRLHGALADPFEANRLMSDLREWERPLQSALAAFRRAESLLDSERSLDTSLRDEVFEMGAALEADQNDLEIARRLDRIRLSSFSLGIMTIDRTAAAKQVERTLQDVGVDLERQSLEELARNIRSSPLRWALIGAVTFWATATEDRGEAERLLALTRSADPDAWRDRLHDPVTWWDREQLEELAASVDPAAQLPQTLHALAVQLHKTQGDPAPLLRRAVRHHPRDFWLHFHLGGHAKDRLEQAGGYRAALAIRPDSEVTHVNLAITLSQLPDYAGAIHHLREALKLDPDLPRAHSLLGGVFTKVNEIEQARRHQARAIELAPDDHIVRYEVGMADYVQGRYDAAAEHLQHAVNAKPHWPPYLEFLAASLQHESKYEQALGHYEKLTELSPQSPEFHFQLGVVLARLGKSEQALESLRKAQQLGADETWERQCEPWIKYAQAALEEAALEEAAESQAP